MDGPRLRVMSYNVHGLGDDVGALVAVVRTLAPDIVLVQEAPRRFRWRQRCAALANSFGMIYAAGGLPALGNLIVTNQRVRVHDTWCLRYPLTPGRHMRGAAFARCSIGRSPFVVAGSHLATDHAERPGQARLLKKAMDDVDVPIIVGADVNEQPDGPAWQVLAAGLIDAGTVDTGTVDAGIVDAGTIGASTVSAGTIEAGTIEPGTIEASTVGAGANVPTFSVGNPRLRIDAIFVDRRFEVRRFEVVDSPLVRRASDHFPIVADLILPT